jgi:adenylyltransferase/sulfurtransferase
MPRFSFSQVALDVPTLQASLEDRSCGGYAAFEGWVRDHNEGQRVTRLEYEAFEELAVREGERIIAEACARFGVTNARCVHRVGDLALGAIAVWVGVSAPHRDEAFRACRYIIDEVKHRVPIWKKEHYVGGDSGWVNCERCATAPLAAHAHHDHDHDHDHEHHHAHATPARSDYARQVALREVGADGQRRLRAARIGVVGAGGLGVPALQYLAGAGVGQLVVIDGDTLEPSNLHRQTWYALADCGRPKAELAAARIRALNPEVAVTAHRTKLDARNALELLRDCDVVLDCTDNFATKFALNDVAHALAKPVVFASVHQYEGQLQVVDPTRNGACLRCIWPQATRDGVVGNCAEAGVLGPVPGLLGTLQALETLKILLNLPGRLGDELLVVDALGIDVTRVRARRAADCAPGACVRRVTASDPAATPTAALECSFENLEPAVAAGYVVIDIRDADEVATRPLPHPAVRHVPMNELLSGRNLPNDARYLLVCARGVRSRGAAETLRDRGIAEVYSLRGGAQALV